MQNKNFYTKPQIFEDDSVFHAWVCNSGKNFVKQITIVAHEL